MNKPIEELKREAEIATQNLQEANRRKADMERAEFRRRVEEFEKSRGVHVGISDDYAVLTIGVFGPTYGGIAGNLGDRPIRFYYGYEKTFCPVHGPDKDSCDETDCDESEWAFVVDEQSAETLRIGRSGLSPDEDEPAALLLSGIGLWVSDRLMKEGTK